MSTNDPPHPLLDQAALAVQTLRRANRADVLVRIDNTFETAKAPYQFDAARGILHRRECRAIPGDAPLYGLWHLSRDDLKHACKRCTPVPDQPHKDETTDRIDLLFGLMSLVDQFGGVLKERGKDYQHTDEGRRLSDRLGTLYRALGQREKEVLDAMLTTLDAVVVQLRALDRSLNRKDTDGSD